MLKMVVIDDEPIELEGITKLINWSKYDIEIVGSAWNGIEGRQVINDTCPDIVITDIQMPGMNGIEMIRALKNEGVATEFIILSGYGDYFYTSQAMELSVKYYLLKPCNEQSIVRVLMKVKEEIETKKISNGNMRKGVNEDMEPVYKDAKAQFLHRSISNAYIPLKEYDLYRDFLGSQKDKLHMVIFRFQQTIGEHTCFVCFNVFEELIGSDHILMKTEKNIDQIVLLISCNPNKLYSVIDQTKMFVHEYFNLIMTAAVSEYIVFDNLYSLYEDTCKQFDGISDQVLKALDRTSKLIESMRRTQSYKRLLIQVYSLLTAFQMYALSKEEVVEACRRITNKIVVTNPKKDDFPGIDRNMLSVVVEFFVEEQSIIVDENYDKLKEVIILILSNLHDPELSLQWLAEKKLYMNPNYLSRLFQNVMGKKFTEFVSDLQMEAARIILELDPSFLVSNVAEKCGFNPDAQYFNKKFKKYWGQSIIEIRSKIFTP